MKDGYKQALYAMTEAAAGLRLAAEMDPERGYLYRAYIARIQDMLINLQEVAEAPPGNGKQEIGNGPPL